MAREAQTRDLTTRIELARGGSGNPQNSGKESSLQKMEYVCEVCKQTISPDARGEIRLEGVTHVSAPKAWVWGPVTVHEECRLHLHTPYDDRIGAGYISTWQKMSA
jgi:hypothetical protein